MPMNLSLIVALALSTASSPAISMQGSSAPKRLPYDEKMLVERLTAQVSRCTTTECREQAYDLIVQIMKLRRSVKGQSMSDLTLSRLKGSCDDRQDDLQAIHQCLRDRQNLSFEDGMRLAGYTKAGITSEGYAQIRIGMEMREVEYILDGYGDEMSYASSGGYSASVYQWTAGRRIIVVSFSDYKVSGRSQSGL